MMKLIINIKNDEKLKKFIDFIKEIPYVEIEEDDMIQTFKGKNKLPETFYKPLKVKKMQKFNREEIYEDSIH